MSRRRRFLPPFELEVQALGPKGTGTGMAPDGRPVKVKGVAPGTRVLVRGAGKKKGVWLGRKIRTIRPAASRAQPRCAVFDLCGGCQLQEISADAQREAKLRHAVELVQPSPEVRVHPIRKGSAAYGYRNKVELSFGVRRYLSEEDHAAGLPVEGRFLGFHAPGRFDRVVDAVRCELVDDQANRLIRIVRDHALSDGAPPPWDNKSHEGFWRHLVLRQGQQTGQRVVILVTATPSQGIALDALAGALMAEPEVIGVQWRVNDGVADVARGEVLRTWGSAQWMERLGDVTLQLGPESFFQTSTPGAEALYDCVAEALGTGGGTLLDLYCGVGSIGLYLANNYDRVVGLEEVQPAVEQARANALANRVDGVWRAARVEDALDALVGGAETDVVVDPPRAGLHPRVARKLARTGARSLVYVACNPASLGRDAAILAEGWRLTDLYVVDLFPQTGHVEAVGRFEWVG